MNSGIPPDRIIIAPPLVTVGQCAYEAAESVWRAMRDRNIRPKAPNVFTADVHGRRSRLVFAKALHANMDIGVIAWIPRGYGLAAWWHSSERAGEYYQGDRRLRFWGFIKLGRGFQSPPG
jgi:hypothetical protein